MDHYILKPLCKSLLRGVCYNCTKFAIDDYSFLHSDDSGRIDKGDNWHAVPFPSDFHYNRHIKAPFPWENTKRPILVSYIGSTRSYYGPARRLRGSIVHYCGLHPSLCVHTSYGENHTRSSFQVPGHKPLLLAQKSVFCFQPIGDLMTRKGLFDSMLQGCIPVVFDKLTASVMYTLHWPEEYWDSVVVELLFHPTAFRYFDPVAALRDMLLHNRSAVLRKQQLLRERVFQLQYGLDGRYLNHPPQQLLAPSAGARAHNTTRPKRLKLSPSWPLDSAGPQDDAFDVLIDRALAWHSGNAVQQRTGTVPECWNGWLDVAANKCKPGKPPS